MRWPWVSRLAYDNAIADVAWLKQWIDREYQPTVTVAPTPDLAIPGAARPERSFLREAIRDQAQGDARLVQYLSSYAARLKRENPDITDEERAQMVSDWSTTEPDTATEQA